MKTLGQIGYETQQSKVLELKWSHRHKYREWYEDIIIERTAWGFYKIATDWF